MRIPYVTKEDSALEGTDFERTEGELLFEDAETAKDIKINVIDQEEYHKKKTFHVTLLDPILPTWEKDITLKDFPKIDEKKTSIDIILIESEVFKV